MSLWWLVIQKKELLEAIDSFRSIIWSTQKELWLIEQQKNNLIEEINWLNTVLELKSKELNNIRIEKETLQSEIKIIKEQSEIEYKNHISQKELILLEIEKLTKDLNFKKKELEDYNKIKLIDKESENKKALNELSLINQEYSISSLKLDQIKIEIANFELYRKQSLMILDAKEKELVSKQDQLNSKESLLTLKEARLNEFKKELKRK